MIGYRFFRTSQIDWRLHHGALIPLTMPNSITKPNRWDLFLLLIRHRALFVRWEERFDQIGFSEWWHIIKNESENLDSLSKKTRYGIRCGQRRFIAVPSSREEICNGGFDVYIAAFDRYETFEPMLSLTKFQEAINSLPSETEFWEVRDRESGEIVAFSENLVRDDACFYNTVWFGPAALKAYAGYVLFHEMNKHYLNDRGLQYVSDGARSISHQTNVHDFLQQKFGFRKAFSDLHVQYLPGIGLLVKFLYLFKDRFARSSYEFSNKISVLLRQEGIRRACLKSRSNR